MNNGPQMSRDNELLYKSFMGNEYHRNEKRIMNNLPQVFNRIFPRFVYFLKHFSDFCTLRKVYDMGQMYTM